jgi:hypothetical protein
MLEFAYINADTSSKQDTPMKARCYATFFMFLLLIPVILSAQDSSAESFTPFAQNLRVATREPQVRISWEDNSGIAKKFLLYRHNLEIVGSNLSQATLVAELPAVTTSYTDVPPGKGSWYYAVILEDASGTVYNLLIPFRNKTTNPIVIQNDPVLADLATKLSGIQARIQGQYVIISILSSRNNRKVAIYRSSKPIATAADLSNAVLLTTLTGSDIRYEDQAIPGIPYFYAVIDAEISDSVNIPIEIGQNSLARAVEVNLSTIALAGISLPGPRLVRPFPLPRIQDLLGKSQLPERRDHALSPTVQEKLFNILPNSKQQPASLLTSKIALLPSDRLTSSSDQGNAANLQEILRSYFANGEYQLAHDRLLRLSRLDLSGDTRIKTRYYLALSKIALGDFRGAVLDLLLVRTDLKEYVEPWLNEAMARL